MGILALPPSGIITDNDGIVIGRSSDGKGYLLTGGTEGQVPVIQGDGTIAYGAAGASSLSELSDWTANTLTVPGALTVRQAGGVAGTDEIQIYHNGTDAHVVPQSGALYFTSAGANGPQVNSSGELANVGGGAECTIYGVGAALSAPKTRATVVGYNAGSGGESVAIGTYTYAGSAAVAIGAGVSTNSSNRCFAADNCTVIGYQAQSSFAHSVVIGRSARSTASYQLVIGTDGGFRIEDVYIGRGVVNATPSDTTYHATGGSGTDIAGASLYLAGGKGTGSGAGGDVIIQHAPAGASGTSLNSLVDVVKVDSQGLTVLQPGGVAGTDEVQIYHDGTDGYIESKSGNLIVPGSTTIQGTLLCDDFSVNYGDFTINSDTLYIYFDCDTNQNMQFRSTGGASFINQLVAKGTLIARQNGGVAGTDEVQIYHDGTDAYISPQSGNLVLPASVQQITDSGNQIEWTGAFNANLKHIGTGDLYITTTNNDIIISPASGSQSCLAVNYLTGVVINDAGVGFWDFRVETDNYDSAIFVDASEDKVSFEAVDVTIESTLKVLQPGGVAGTDEIQIYHDGTNGNVVSQSGDLYLSSDGASGPKINSSGQLVWNKGTSSVFLGEVNASADGGNVVIGYNASNLQYSVVAIGNSATANRSGVAIGASAIASGVESIVIGGGATTGTWGACVAIGTGATTTYPNSVAVGRGAKAHNQNVNIGAHSTSLSPSAASVAIGYASNSGVYGNVVVGWSASADSLNNCVVLGAQAIATASSQFVVGSDYAPILNQYIGRGVVSATPEDFTLHATGGSGTDISGANLILAGGKGTGTGVGGSVVVQAAPVGLAGTSLNSLVDVAEFDADTTAGNTRFLIYDVDNGQLERVSVGAADSGGAGYKLLRIAN